MRSGFSPSTSAVPAASVTVDGTAREVVSVSSVRELGGGGVPGLSATAAAEGSVSWAQLPNATSEPQGSPWSRVGNWPPAPGSAVQVDMGTRTESFRALTGVIDSSSAGSDGVVSSTLVDPVDRLHRRINLFPYLHSMPPLTQGDPSRNVGMSSDWIADIVLRRCAYFTTPYMFASMSGVNVPGTGSLWPERGEVVSAGRYGAMNLGAQFLGGTHGWGIYSGDATYTPDGVVRAATGLTIAAMVATRHANLSTITVSEGAGTWLLRIRADQTVALEYNGSVLVQIGAGARKVEAYITSGAATLNTDDGRSVRVLHSVPTSVTTAAVESVRLQVQAGSNINGIMVGDMPERHFLDYPLNARIVGGTNMTPMLLASPRLVDRDALDVLTEIAEATCRSFWWDEDGTFQWHPGDVLLSRAPVHTITSLDSLIDLGWSESLADTYRAVQVAHRTPALSRSLRPNVTLWQGSGDSLESGQYAEEIAAPSTDEEWIMPQWSPRIAGGTFLNEHNHGRGSVWGGVISDGQSTSWAQWTSGALTLGMVPLGNQAAKYTYQVGSIPASKKLELTFPNDSSTSAVWSRWRSEKLPIIRGFARVEWVESNTEAGSGPVAGGDYQHDGGKWVQGISGEAPGNVADFLAQYLCTTRASANGVRVVHDPRIQVGDVVSVRDEHAHDIELQALVTRVEQSVSAGESDMTLDLFIISGTGSALGVTLGQHDLSMSGSTMNSHDLGEDGLSMNSHNINPKH